MKTPISINLKEKVVVITGAGGVICGCLAKALASNGAKVALLDLNLEAAEAVANEIVAEGGVAKAYKTNVLDKENLEVVREEIEKGKGKQFDPVLADIMLQLIKEDVNYDMRQKD